MNTSHNYRSFIQCFLAIKSANTPETTFPNSDFQEAASGKRGSP